MTVDGKLRFIVCSVNGYVDASRVGYIDALCHLVRFFNEYVEYYV